MVLIIGTTMKYTNKARCGYVLVDCFESNEVPIFVYVLANKQAVKQYCRETGLSFTEGLLALYGK